MLQTLCFLLVVLVLSGLAWIAFRACTASAQETSFVGDRQTAPAARGRDVSHGRQWSRPQREHAHVQQPNAARRVIRAPSSALARHVLRRGASSEGPPGGASTASSRASNSAVGTSGDGFGDTDPSPCQLYWEVPREARNLPDVAARRVIRAHNSVFMSSETGLARTQKKRDISADKSDYAADPSGQGTSAEPRSSTHATPPHWLSDSRLVATGTDDSRERPASNSALAESTQQEHGSSAVVPPNEASLTASQTRSGGYSAWVTARRDGPISPSQPAQTEEIDHAVLRVTSWAALDRASHGVAVEGVLAERDELLRVWWAEVGPRALRSHAASGHVLQRYADSHGTDIIGAADAMVWRFSDAQVHRPWLRYLDSSCAEPDGYPGEWDAGVCLEVVARVDAFMRGELRDPTRGRATQWRSPGRALRRALRKGYVRVRCVGGCSLRFIRCPKARCV